jgi:outer membrane protein
MTGKSNFTAFLAVFLLISVNIVFAEESAGKPLSYEECAALALQNSNAHKIQSEKLKQANLDRLSAIGAVLPGLSLNYDSSYTNSNSGFNRTGWESSLAISESLTNGFDSLSVILEKDRLAAKEEFNLAALERKIKEDTAAAFYTLASAQSDLINSQEALSLMTEREQELRQREALGKSRLSELYSVQSGVALLNAQLEQVKNNTDKAADLLALTTGEKSTAIVQPVETDAAAPELNADALAPEQPEVKAIDADIEAAGRKILGSESAFLPQVGFQASTPLGGTAYPGANEWVFSIQANWAVFDRGSRVFGTMTEFSKEEALKQQRLAAIKMAAFNIKSKVRDYRASVSRSESLKIAYEKSNKSFKLIQKDYRMGMATNIEVIQSMTDMINVKKALDNEVIAKEKNKVLLEILK